MKLYITLIYCGVFCSMLKRKKPQINPKSNKIPKKQQRKKWCIFATQVKILLSLFSFLCKRNNHVLTVTLLLYFSKISIFRICIPSITFISIPLFFSLTSFLTLNPNLECFAGWLIIRECYKKYERTFLCMCMQNQLTIKQSQKTSTYWGLPSNGEYSPPCGSRQLKKAKVCIKEIRDVLHLKGFVMKIYLFNTRS